MSQFGRLDPKSLLLIRQVEKHPALYGRAKGSFIPRGERRRIWDHIAKVCGFDKTADAKNRWRGLVMYLRQHVANVMKRAKRRYVPNTGIPQDKYVQLEDWRYFQHIKFMMPFITNVAVEQKSVAATQTATTSAASASTSKCGTSNTANKSHFSCSTISNDADSINLSIHSQSDEDETASTATLRTQEMENAQDSVELLGNASKRLRLDSSTIKATTDTMTESASFESLSVEDQNLKSFFDAMLRSTLLLPEFHQQRIQGELLKVIRKQRGVMSV